MGRKKQVYIKFQHATCIEDILLQTLGQADYKHNNGEILQVRISAAGSGLRKMHIANLPPQMPEEVIHS